MKKLIILSFTSLISAYSLAQLVNLEWAYSMGGIKSGVVQIDIANSISVDPQNNFIVTGEFDNTADFDPDSNQLNITTKGKYDIFIQKINENGQLIWVHTIGGTQIDGGTHVTTDKFGNIYVAGIFSGTVDFDPGSSVFNLTSNGYIDVFALKLDSSGNFIWAKSAGGTGFDRAAHMEVDINGNVYLLGNFENTVDFNPGSAVLNVSSNGGTDYFLQKFDSSGTFQWVKTFGSSSNDLGGSLLVDDIGNLYVTGCFQGTLDFDPSTLVSNKTSNGDKDAFIQKLSAAGNFQWVQTFGGPGDDLIMNITSDGMGHFYITGSFEDSVDFDPGTNVNMQYSSSYEDAYVEKFDLNGNMVWVKTMGSNKHHKGIGIVSTGAYIYTIGWCQGTADYDPGPDTFNITAQGNQFDTFVQKLDSDGDFVWAFAQGGKNYDIPTDIKVDANGNLLTSGYFEDTADFDPGFSRFKMESNGGGDVFVQKLSECDALTGTEKITACVQYTWKDGITYTESNNTATHGVINELTCDSVITLDLTIIPVESNVNVSGNVMIANAVGASYQWLDCSNGYQPIPGEITRSYIATQNGSYAVEVTENGCTDTSSCISINSVGFNDVSITDVVNIFPNPSQGKVNVDLGKLTDSEITIYALDQRVMYRQEGLSSGLHLFELDLPSGVYLVEILSAGEMGYMKLVME